jgi:hypothetical protein
MSAIANSNQSEDKPKTSRVQSYWQNTPWRKLSSLVIAIALCFYLTACGDDGKATSKPQASKIANNINIIEVSPPAEIQRLSSLLDRYEPQVSIISPKPDDVLNEDQVSIKFDVKNLPIFKNAEFGLGPHIHVTLDNQEYKGLYDLNQTVTFEHLSAGTHIVRAFASRPWHESFKNEGAYAQTTFNVLTKTGENTPELKAPLLSYSRPVGTYGAEPIMLDFYLQNAPLHLLGKDDEVIDDWQVRATIDGQSFTFDRWEPIYLKGFKTGQNWVKLELLEPDGDAIANIFNSTAHLINYQPNGSDTLARLVRGEKIANIEAIVDPNYVAPAVIPTPVESVAPVLVLPPVTAPVATPKAEVAIPVTAPVATPKIDAKAETKPTEKAKSIIPVETPPESAPIPLVIKAEPITAPIKTAPVKIAPVKVKTMPVVVEPVKPIAVSKPQTTPVVVAPVKAIASPKVEAPKITAPITAPKKTTDLPTSTDSYLKNYLDNRKMIKTNTEKAITEKAIETPVTLTKK